MGNSRLQMHGGTELYLKPSMAGSTGLVFPVVNKNLIL